MSSSRRSRAAGRADVFGINGGELIVLLVIAAVVVGPERLPGYAEQLARWVRALRGAVATGRTRLSAELGEEDLDWAALDPRRYDPRRIVREALADTLVEPAPRRQSAVPTGGPAPFDDEAT